MNKLTKREKDYLSQANLKGYLEIENSCRVNLKNAFFDFCRENNIPRLILIKTRHYFYIDIDFITTNYELAENEIKIFKEIYNRYSHSKSVYSFSKILIIIDKIKLEYYENFKREILVTLKDINTSRNLINNFFEL